MVSIRRWRSLDDCLNYLRVRSKAIAAEDVSKVLDLRFNELIFLAFELYFGLTQGLENESEYTKMIVQVCTFKCNIIQVLLDSFDWK